MIVEENIRDMAFDRSIQYISLGQPLKYLTGKGRSIVNDFRNQNRLK